MKYKAAFFEVEDWEREHIKKGLKNANIVFFGRELDSHSINDIKNIDVLSVFIYSKITREVIGKLPKLKLIATMSTGYEHIDLEDTVAEHTFALILALSRKICQSYERTKKGDFSLEGLRGFDLKGKTLGVVGAGSIGQHVIRIAGGFEMNVVAFDVRKDAALAKKLGFKYANLNNLLKISDIITLHAPYNKFTHHMINKSNIHLIRKGALLVNTSRGGLIETEALVEALSDKTLAGAGLDVLEEECSIKEEKQLLSKKFPLECNLKTMLQNHIMLEQDNVIITPHNAFNSGEALKRIIDMTIENIKAFQKGKPTNVVKEN